MSSQIGKIEEERKELTMEEKLALWRARKKKLNKENTSPAVNSNKTTPQQERSSPLQTRIGPNSALFNNRLHNQRSLSAKQPRNKSALSKSSEQSQSNACKTAKSHCSTIKNTTPPSTISLPSTETNAATAQEEKICTDEKEDVHGHSASQEPQESQAQHVCEELSIKNGADKRKTARFQADLQDQVDTITFAYEVLFQKLRQTEAKRSSIQRRFDMQTSHIERKEESFKQQSAQLQEMMRSGLLQSVQRIEQLERELQQEKQLSRARDFS